jgi:hypothetical protein
MQRKRTIRGLGAAIALGAAVLAAAACSSGPSQSDFDKVNQQLKDEQTQNQQLQQQAANAPKAGASPAAAPSAAASAAAGDVKWLLGAKKVPPATPAPTLAPGAPTPTSAPKVTPSAAFYNTPQPYSVYVEVLTASRQSSFDILATAGCTPASLFVRGQRIVWRYEIIDTSTGKRLTDLDGAKVKIVLPNSVEAAGAFSQRGGGKLADAPFMWGSNWDIPLDYPLGGIDYKVMITTKDGKSFTWSPPVVVAPDGSSDSRPKVAQ